MLQNRMRIASHMSHTNLTINLYDKHRGGFRRGKIGGGGANDYVRART